MSENSFKVIVEDSLQLKAFLFSSDNLVKAKNIIKMYPSNYKESSIISFFQLLKIK